MSILNWLRDNILKKFMIRINQQAITNWTNWLNTNFPPANWVPINGWYTMTSLDFDANKNPIFNGNAGYPLKGFVNTATGEVKVFDARKFYE